MNTKHIVTFTCHFGQKVKKTFSDLSELDKQISYIKDKLDSTPSTATGVLTINYGHELQALELYKSSLKSK
jgi:hypothetical protein